MEKKICKKCKEEKETCEFGVHNSTKDKLRTICNECRKIEGKIYRQQNSEARKLTLKNWYSKNPEYNRNYYLNNTESINKQNIPKNHIFIFYSMRTHIPSKQNFQIET